MQSNIVEVSQKDLDKNYYAVKVGEKCSLGDLVKIDENKYAELLASSLIAFKSVKIPSENLVFRKK